ncbi:MAG: type II toxin-antitoxin system HicB family antitoxin [Lachnospiraceae bacterium]|nr:type II toxin-antitoxin system HicB family antitoxin [Lachnospiraceae bacterium]
MLLIYPAIFHEEDKTYWVEFPDLVGCQSFGTTVNETMENAQEALLGYALTLLEEERPLPKPSAMEEMQTDQAGFVSPVTCDLNRYKNTKAVKKTLTIPCWLNDRATALGINFSKTLQDALLRKIQR